MLMEGPPTSIAPLLLRNLLTGIFMFADKPLVLLAQKHRLLEVLRHFLVSVFLFFLRVLPVLFSCVIPSGETYDDTDTYPLKQRKGQRHPKSAAGGIGGGAEHTGIARALSQLLSLVNDIPVSSRKYEVVRSLAEKLIDENLTEGNEQLKEINCGVLSVAFTRTLSQLEAAMLDRGGSSNDADATVAVGNRGDYYHNYPLSRFLSGVKYYAEVLWQRGRPMSCNGISAEKLAAEVLWLAQKMAACGCAEAAVTMWASVTHLAWLSLSAGPRLQSSLIKASAFLFKQAKNIGRLEDGECADNQLAPMKMRMLMSWLPLLCRGSIGTDAPVLSINERAELEKILEEMIETLEQEERQEQVLSLWLHHFTQCASSDWPNLQECYTRWCSASRKNYLLLQLQAS